MATNYNYFGNLVTSGLVLDLDAAKLASYPGTGTTWYDISGNNLTGSLVNGPTFSGVSKQANFLFDNTDDYVVISSSAAITPRTGDFTSDFWINPTTWTPSNYQPIQVTAITNGLWIGQNASNQFIVRAFGVADRLQYATRPVTGSWSNVSITRNSNLINLYYNGTPVTSSISNQDFVQGTTYLGSDAPGGGGAVYFNGRIASSKYYNRGLSQFEVWQNFNAIKSRYGIPDIVTNGLVLNLDAGNPYSYLSGSSGTTWTNTVAVSSSISGTLVNGPVYANGAITFDGTNDYANLGVNSSCYSPTGFTIDAWVKLTSNTGANPILCIYQGLTVSSNNEYVFGTTGGSLYGWVYDSVNGAYRGRYVNITSLIPSNTWCNITMTYNGGTTNSSVALYINSIKSDTTDFGANAFTTIRNTSSPMIIGAANDGLGGPINGSTSNVKFYTRTLSAAEITQNFNALRGRYGI
jgi:hypothetical protein